MNIRVFGIALAMVGHCCSSAQTGKVVGVTDGDTVTVLIGTRSLKVRLNGIDAPEARQPFGSESKKWLSARVFGKQVRIAQTGTDRYGRVTAWLYCGTVEQCAESVKAGMAWWYRKYAPSNQALRDGERIARAHKRGIWSDRIPPVPPWEWRNEGRTSASRRAYIAASGQAPVRQEVAKQNALDVVFVTATGHKYHRGTCRYIRGTKFASRRLDAIRSSYKPCEVCKP